MAVVLMSRAELSRVDTLARVDRGELPVAGAASLLGLSGRQVFRLGARATMLRAPMTLTA